MSDRIDLQRASRRATTTRMLWGAVAGLVLALAIGAGLWAWTQNLALASALAGLFAILLPGPAAALAAPRRRA
jgi:membrane protein YdbS with pleckstrin-like domain